MSIALKITPTMNLGELASAMGPEATEDEARGLRDLLVSKYLGKSINDPTITETAWVRLVGSVVTREYQLAYMNNDGSFDMVETFDAAGDDAANAYAEANAPYDEWYVLCNGRNINAGCDR